jgi:hypothetical protein
MGAVEGYVPQPPQHPLMFADFVTPFQCNSITDVEDDASDD